MREGIELIIGLQPDLRIVASATNGAEAVELHRQHKPDITLMDLQLPVMRGLDAICAIRRGFEPGPVAENRMHTIDRQCRKRSSCTFFRRFSPLRSR